MNTADIYYLKALDAYPHELEEACQAIQYGLAHQKEHAALLCLMGNIQAYEFRNYEAAVVYFEEALAANLFYAPVYEDYLLLLVRLNQTSKAISLSERALITTGVDKFQVYKALAYLHEKQEDYKQAISMLNTALVHCYNSPAQQYILQEKKRIQEKDDILSKTKKKKKNEENTKK